jgi:Hypothetical glycosyl hydrolase 6
MRTYVNTYRRTLLDMHIPDWDPAFLAHYDPVELADRYATSRIEGVLLYCKSHVGLNYWPAPVGGVHAAAKGRDLVGELVEALRARGMRPAAYHSVVYDNWAAEHHPAWQQVSATTLFGRPNHGFSGPRYGLLCVNNPEYVAYEVEQIQALLRRYDFDAFWVDMVFWPTVCICDHCKRRAKDELGLDEVPAVIDWASPAWATFQEARTRWMNEFWVTLRDAAHAARPGIPIAHNLLPELMGWFTGSMADEIPRDTFAAGDLYGGRDEQLFVSRLMHTLSRGAVAEYMTSRAPNLQFHTQLRSERELLLLALGATAQHLAFLFIDAINPDGTTEPAVYERIGSVFSATAPYEQHLGGTPVSDVAVYYSPRSRVQWDANGKPVADPAVWERSEGAYERAFLGACSALQAAHISFGVITTSTLDDLAHCKVLILPDLARLKPEETEAIRSFVAAGGHIYASGTTSLADTLGHRSQDFALADVFGAHIDGRYEANVVYYRPTVPEVADAISPEPLLSWGARESRRAQPRNIDVHFLGNLAEDTETLAAFTLPYAYPAPGSLHDHQFASIHSSPPWTNTERPALIRHRFGKGLAIYSAVPLEAASADSIRQLFTTLVRSLFTSSPRIQSASAAQVWITLFDQPERSRMVLSLLNYDREHQQDVVALVDVEVGAPAGYRIGGARRTVDGTAVDHTISSDGTRLSLSRLNLPLFEQIELPLVKEF